MCLYLTLVFSILLVYTAQIFQSLVPSDVETQIFLVWIVREPISIKCTCTMYVTTCYVRTYTCTHQYKGQQDVSNMQA